MPATFFDAEGTSHGFMCGPGIESCSVCANLALHLCDYPMGKGKTCDAMLCCNHAIQIRPRPQRRLKLADDSTTEWIEFCPQHAAIHGLVKVADGPAAGGEG